MEDDKKFVPFPHFGTDALHAGQEPEQWKSMAVVPPISMSTTFKQPAPAEHVVGNMCSYVAYCTLYNYPTPATVLACKKCCYVYKHFHIVLKTKHFSSNEMSSPYQS